MKKSKKSVKVNPDLEDLRNNMSETGDLPVEERNPMGEQAGKGSDTDLSLALSEANDKYLRLYSEFDNYRRRTSRERLELIQSASKDLINELLPVLDDFERALKSIHDGGGSESIAKGVELIQHKLTALLEQRGLRAFEAMAREFDPDFHEAVTRIPAPAPELSGKIVDVLEKGYTLHDKVLRYAKVVVGE